VPDIAKMREMKNEMTAPALDKAKSLYPYTSTKFVMGGVPAETFVPGIPHNSGRKSAKIAVTVSHTYTQPGTYFAAIRATSQRQGDAETPYALVRNLGRVRVIVK
jgi:hypothetical protein